MLLFSISSLKIINFLSNFEVNLSALPDGIYFIRLKDQFNPTQINILKVIRQH